MEQHTQQKSAASIGQQQLTTQPPDLNGDFALGLRTLPKSNERPDYARGLRTQTPLIEGPDFARGLRTQTPAMEGPDYARGLRRVGQ